jgi:hypothetical protein
MGTSEAHVKKVTEGSSSQIEVVEAKILFVEFLKMILC